MTRLFGGILLAVGILLMTGSGLCSLAVIVFGVGGTTDPSFLVLPAIIGGIPFALGYGLFRWGRGLLRRADAELPSNDELGDRFG